MCVSLEYCFRVCVFDASVHRLSASRGDDADAMIYGQRSPWLMERGGAKRRRRGKNVCPASSDPSY